MARPPNHLAVMAMVSLLEFPKYHKYIHVNNFLETIIQATQTYTHDTYR
jgi:hypothetical protein